MKRITCNTLVWNLVHLKSGDVQADFRRRDEALCEHCANFSKSLWRHAGDRQHWLRVRVIVWMGITWRKTYNFWHIWYFWFLPGKSWRSFGKTPERTTLTKSESTCTKTFGRSCMTSTLTMDTWSWRRYNWGTRNNFHYHCSLFFWKM